MERLGILEATLMWDSTLYAMNMFYCLWLLKFLLSANGLTEYSQAGKDTYQGMN